MTTRIYGTSTIRRQRRSKAEMDAFHDTLLEIVAAQAPMTVRQAFYQAEVRGLVEKAETGYRKVQRALLILRQAGRLPFSDIVDNTRWQRKPPTHDGLEEALAAAASSYRKAVWAGLDQRIEIWCEKDALAGVLLPVTWLFDVPLLVARGYSSASFAYEAAMEIAHDARRGITTYVYHLGDYDPSGQDAARDLRTKLGEYAPAGSFYFDQLAVLPWQITAWGLPTRPTKRTDSRAKGFAGESVELDAIPPDDLRGLVRDAIEPHLPTGYMDRLQQAEQFERDQFAMMVNIINGQGR